MNNIPSLTTRFSTPVDSMLIAFYHDSYFDGMSKGVETSLLVPPPPNRRLIKAASWSVNFLCFSFDVTVEARVGFGLVAGTHNT